MLKSSNIRHCLQIKLAQLWLVLFCVCTHTTALADAPSRKPANFMPDDDLIMVPIQYESPFLARVIDPNNQQMKELKLQLNYWTEQQLHVEDWGLESTNMIALPSSDEKLRYFQRTFFRYAGREARDPVQQEVRSIWYEWTADQEVQAIKNNDQDIDAKSSTEIGRKLSKQKVISENSKMRFRFKPQPFKGFASISMTSGYFNANAVMGINGRFEFKIDRRFESVGLYAMANINLSDDIKIAYIEKQLTDKISLGLSHTISETNAAVTEDNRLTLRYYTAF
jgi:hypothetical protein